MTKQETFETVVTHLRKQNEKAEDTEMCRYRLKKGNKILKCAVGCLIPDDKYRPEFEGKLIDYKPITDLLLLLGHDFYLVARLQYVHDTYPVDEWERGLLNTALHFNLTMI